MGDAEKKRLAVDFKNALISRRGSGRKGKTQPFGDEKIYASQNLINIALRNFLKGRGFYENEKFETEPKQHTNNV